MKFTKKFLCVLLCAVTVLSFASCGDTSSGGPSDSGTNPDTQDVTTDSSGPDTKSDTGGIPSVTDETPSTDKEPASTTSPVSADSPDTSKAPESETSPDTSKAPETTAEIPDDDPTVSNKVKVIILAGQSNAVGVSYTGQLGKHVSASEYDKYKNGFDGVRILFHSGVNNDDNYCNSNIDGGKFEKVDCTMGITDETFGPELGFAETVAEAMPDETVYIIKAAWGAANLYDEFASPSTGKTGAFYMRMVNIIDRGLEILKNDGLDPEIVAFLWMQGESDAVYPASALAYGKNFSAFVYDIRSRYADFAYDGKIAIIDAEISGVWPYFARVNGDKNMLSEHLDDYYVVPTISEGLTTSLEPEGNVDIAHYDSLSQIKLGHLFAQTFLRIVGKNR